MLRAVLDTNLLISYLLTQGETLSSIIDHWEAGHFILVTSPAILAELKEVVQRPRLRPYFKASPDVLIELIELEAQITRGELVLNGVCRDPKDDIFLACAVEGNADYIATGDEDLLVLSQCQQVKIVKPDAFVRLLEEAK